MKKQFSGTEIVGKLRQADVLIAQGKTVSEVCREIGVTSQTCYKLNETSGAVIDKTGNYDGINYGAIRGAVGVDGFTQQGLKSPMFC